MVDIIRIKYKSIIPLLFLLAALYIVDITLIVTQLVNSVNTIFLLTQLVFVPITSFIILFLFSELFGSNNSLFLYTYYKKNIIKIYSVSLFIGLIPMILVCAILSLGYDDFNALAALLLLFSELLLFSSASLFLFSLISDISIIITLFVLYISVEVATFGSYSNFYHIFYMDLRNNINFENTISLIVINLIFGVLSLRIFKTSNS